MAFTALQEIRSKSNKWSFDFSLSWTCCSVVSNHRSHHRRFCASNFIYLLITVSATANDVYKFGFGDGYALE